MINQTTYLIAIVPPEKTCKDVLHYKRDFADRFESFSALESVPHITLKRPFQAAFAEKRLLKWFNSLDLNQKSFTLQLEDFGIFENRKDNVMFIKVCKNKALLNLQNLLLQMFESTFANEYTSIFDTEYQPHLTIAHGDLTPNNIKNAWKEYKFLNYKNSFVVKEIHLLELISDNWILKHSRSLNETNRYITPNNHHVNRPFLNDGFKYGRNMFG